MDENCTGQAEMPRYVCHKEVHALKIERIEFERSFMNGGNEQTFGDF
jgi:hypothetical protein